MRIERIRNRFTHGTPAFAAIEFASVMRLHSLRAPRTSFDSFANAFFIDTSADANDHANDLQQVRMIVKNDSQLQVRDTAQETGGESPAALAEWVHDDCIDASERTKRRL